MLLVHVEHAKRRRMKMWVVVGQTGSRQTTAPNTLNPHPHAHAHPPLFFGRATLEGVAGGDNVSGKVKVVVSVAEVTAWGDFTASPVSSFQTEALSSLGRDSSGVVEAAFLEAAEGASCAAGAAGDSRVCFRALVVKEDDSAVMVGEGGLEWVREEALAAVDQVWIWSDVVDAF